MIGITLNELCIVVAIAILVGTGIGLAIGFGAWWQAPINQKTDETMTSRTKTFELCWRDGHVQVVTGPDIVTAMVNAGIGAGGLRVLDDWKEVREPSIQKTDES